MQTNESVITKFYTAFQQRDAATMAGAAGYFFPAIRQAEDLLPDHDDHP